MMRTKKGHDLWSLPQRGSRNAYVHISRFPKLIKFIREYEDKIPDDLWELFMDILYVIFINSPTTGMNGQRKKMGCHNSLLEWIAGRLRL